MTTTKAWIIILLLMLIVSVLFLRFKSIYNTLFAILLALIVPFVAINFNHITSPNQSIDQKSIIVILGAGINNNETPTDILKKRLETGAELYNQTNQTIVVTGDNSKIWHNEPRVMKNYLIRLGIPARDIVEDFGGRRTMDSCYRVKYYFGASNITLVSQAFHLPRARFLCQTVGLNVETKAAQDSGFVTLFWGYMREIPASWSAFVDSIYFQPQVGSNGKEELR